VVDRRDHESGHFNLDEKRTSELGFSKKVVGSLGPDGRLKFIWTPPKRKTVFGVMIDRLRLQFYIRPLMQTEACGP
jgi:hypothetical protein